jgi:hypothetical protein
MLLEGKVDLYFARDAGLPGRLTGSVGEDIVRVDLHVHTHHGTVNGTFAGMAASAHWENGDNYTIFPDVPSEMKGVFAGQSVELHGSFHLEPRYSFDRGAVSGSIGSDLLVARVNGAAGGSRSVAADGTLGDTSFTIHADINGSLTRGHIGGTVDGFPIRVDATREVTTQFGTPPHSQQPGDSLIHLGGTYKGPGVLLAVMVGAFLHFM